MTLEENKKIVDLKESFDRRKFIKLASVSVSASVWQPQKSSGGGAEMSPRDVGNRKQLFIDRRFIACSKGISLSINPPRKMGPLMVIERPWEKYRIGGYLSVLDHQGLYKMWYVSWSKEGSHTSYATSSDGIHWKRGLLNLLEFDGSRADNLVLNNSAEGAVFLDPVAPPHQQFKTLISSRGGGMSPLGNRTSGKKGSLWLLASPDGLHWKEEYPVLPFQPDTYNCLFWDEGLQKYAAYLRGWNPLRVVVRCEISKGDILKPWPYTPAAKPFYLWGKDWAPAITTELPTVMAADEMDPANCDVYTPNVERYPWADDSYLAFPAWFHHTAPPGSEKVPLAGLSDVYLAVSRDGIHWERPDRQPYLGLGLPGDLDTHLIRLGLGMIRRGSEIYQYYGGLASDHSIWPPPPNTSALMLLVQRLDGFVSANAAYSGGELTTPPIIFKGNKLQLNIDTSAMGSAQVELIGADQLPVTGFELRNCDPIITNDVAREVTWKGNADVSRLREKPISLRFVMRNTRLFAFQFV